MAEEEKKSEEKNEHKSHSHKDGNCKKKKILVALVAALVVLSFIQVVQLSNLNKKFAIITEPLEGGQAAPSPSAAPPTPTARVKVSEDDDYVKGEKNAPVTIIEFSDYECPFCGRFYSQTLPQIEEKYVKTGKVKMVYRDFPLGFHPKAEPAAIAANCAGEQGKYYEMHDLLFENQPSLSDANYKKWAGELGLDAGKFATCLKDPKQKAEVQKDMRDGQAAGVQGTPAFFINGQLISGAQPFPAFEQAIEAALSE
jgi:protein-disulfide isomerase